MPVVVPEVMCCWGDLGDFLDFLLNECFICALRKKQEGDQSSDGPTTPNTTLLVSALKAYLIAADASGKPMDKSSNGGA